MRKITVINHLTLDGVMQSPSGPDEDLRGGFEHGGWAAGNMDEVMGRVMGEGMSRGGPLLFGRHTYEQFFSYWPKQTGNPITDVLNKAQKYVASRTLTEPLPWENSTLLEGDAADAVAALKETPGDDLGILGSGQLIESLMQRNLIDEYLLLIHPLILGSGIRMFTGDAYAALRLVESVTTTKGVLIARYEAA
jgi:dihydrofolate reductase